MRANDWLDCGSSFSDVFGAETTPCDGKQSAKTRYQQAGINGNVTSNRHQSQDTPTAIWLGSPHPIRSVPCNSGNGENGCTATPFYDVVQLSMHGNAIAPS